MLLLREAQLLPLGVFLMENVIAELRAALPPAFLGSKLDELAGYAIAWGTVQNRRSRREIPNEDEIFIRSGNRVLVRRDPFLAWFATTLAPVRRPPVMQPRRGRPRTRSSTSEANALAAEGDGRRSAQPRRMVLP